MDKELAEKWVKNLRSGYYKQTFKELRNKEKTHHCAVGVLMDITGGFNIEWKGKSVEHLKDFICQFIKHDSGVKISTMNDGNNKSFNEIADFIEVNYLDL